MLCRPQSPLICRKVPKPSSPAKAGDPVFQSVPVHPSALWNTGSPGRPRSGRGQAPGDDIRVCALILATAFRPSFAISFASSQERGRREDRVRAAPAVSCACGLDNDAHEQTGSAETLRPSLRNGLTAYAVLSLVTGFLTPSPPEGVNLPGTSRM